MIRRSNQNCNFSISDVLYETCKASVLHTCIKQPCLAPCAIRAHANTHTYAGRFLVCQKFKKIEKTDNSLRRNIVTADKLTNITLHDYMHLLSSVSQEQTRWLPAEYQGQCGRRLAETEFRTFSTLNILCFIGECQQQKLTISCSEAS